MHGVDVVVKVDLKPLNAWERDELFMQLEPCREKQVRALLRNKGIYINEGWLKGSSMKVWGTSVDRREETQLLPSPLFWQF